ncbi:MAG: hypothetical protein M1824_003134 [Vezdaea acicularis]|nr:MAG: hypothetical protein M1824_003134 [Vezdaea acicularis]
MPLIVPGITSNSGDPKTEWQNKLIGKTLKDSESKTDEISFAKKDLPPKHRVIEQGSMVTQDFNPDRLNVYVGENGIVTHVDYK